MSVKSAVKGLFTKQTILSSLFTTAIITAVLAAGWYYEYFYVLMPENAMYLEKVMNTLYVNLMMCKAGS